MSPNPGGISGNAGGAFDVPRVHYLHRVVVTTHTKPQMYTPKHKLSASHFCFPSFSLFVRCTWSSLCAHVPFVKWSSIYKRHHRRDSPRMPPPPTHKFIFVRVSVCFLCVESIDIFVFSVICLRWLAEFGGVEVGPKEDKLGIRASSTCPVTFSGCEVPKGNVLGEVSDGETNLIGRHDALEHSSYLLDVTCTANRKRQETVNICNPSGCRRPSVPEQ